MDAICREPSHLHSETRLATTLWKHCPGRENPADIPSRGLGALALADTPLWLNGPDWLYYRGGLLEEFNSDFYELPIPDDCRSEKVAAHSLITLQGSILETSGLSQLIDPEQYSSLIACFVSQHWC